MITKFTCKCGNTDPKKAHFYDGALGYEALVCKVCGAYYDHDEKGKERYNKPDDFGKQFVTNSN